MKTRSVAYAVVRDESPTVFLAEDVDVLQRVIATKVVAQTDRSTLPGYRRSSLREALLNEQWGDAVSQWIEHTGIPVDVYTNIEVWNEEMLPGEVNSFELRTTPLFRD